jgi:flap endonuclease-1
MGIKNLNKLLTKYCTSNAIQPITFQQIAHKTIAIDASIYMYKYIEKEELVEKMHLMIATFTQKYNITPIFVFDGKPPEEKKELIDKRREKRKEAQHEYNTLKHLLNQKRDYSSDMSSSFIDYEQRLMTLKKQSVKIQEYHVRKMKRLLNAMGIQYIEAEGEADTVCTELVLSNKVYACMSEDMDMLLYGCTRILRQSCFVNHSALLYDTSKILEEMNISLPLFRRMILLAGTDYNKPIMEMHQAYDLYLQYNSLDMNMGISFYEWICREHPSKYEIDIDELEKTNRLFELSMENTNKLEIVDYANSVKNHDELQIMLQEAGFIL